LNISTPYVWVDLDVMEKNINKMTSDLKKHKVKHRPHIKTHKSIEIARMQLKAGAIGITCAKISEAKVMAEAGIKDILIAYSIVGEDKIKRLGNLLDIADIKTTVDNIDTAKQLSELALSKGKKLKIYIEVETPLKRGGVRIGKDLVDFTRNLCNLDGILFEGLFGYYGLDPNLKTLEDIQTHAKKEVDNLVKAKFLLENNGFKVKYLSGGSSVTSVCPKELEQLTESRAGNYVFFDLNYVKFGAASLENCALKVKSTIISKPEPNYFTADAGSKTLGSDTKENMGFGYIVNHPGAKIYKLNEEHAFVRYDSSKEKFKVGQIIEIIPNHSCILPNLCDYIFAFRKGRFERKIRIDARGKNY